MNYLVNVQTKERERQFVLTRKASPTSQKVLCEWVAAQIRKRLQTKEFIFSIEVL
jgi:hypothetical protein